MICNEILFPLTCGEAENSAKRDVEWLARCFGSRVTLVDVFESSRSFADTEAYYCSPDPWVANYRHAKSLLCSYRIDVPENRVERILLEGDPLDQIPLRLHAHPVDLVVLGSESGLHMTEVLTGSLATRLMHNSSCDIWFGSHKSNSVLEARNGARFCILCATGLTEEGVPLLRYTDQIAQILDAEVSIVHSISDNRVFSSEYGDPNFLAHARVNAAAELDRMQAQAGTAYPMRISFGGISKAVRDAAREEHPNLIVIGRGKSQRHFGPLWTHAYSIIREAECPVLSYGCDAGAEFASGQADEASSERHGVAACV